VRKLTTTRRRCCGVATTATCERRYLPNGLVSLLQPIEASVARRPLGLQLGWRFRGEPFLPTSCPISALRFSRNAPSEFINPSTLAEAFLDHIVWSSVWQLPAHPLLISWMSQGGRYEVRRPLAWSMALLVPGSVFASAVPHERWSQHSFRWQDRSLCRPNQAVAGGVKLLLAACSAIEIKEKCTAFSRAAKQPHTAKIVTR